MDFGIKYLKIEIDDKTFLLLPKEIVVGNYTGNYFYTDTDKISLIRNSSNLKQRVYFIDDIKKIDEIKSENHISDQDLDMDFLMEYYYCEKSNYILVVSVINDTLIKNKIKIDDLKNKTTEEIYTIVNSRPVVLLNNGSLSALFEMNSIEKIKEKLVTLQKGMDALAFHNKKQGINNFVVTNCLVSSLETDTKIYIPDYKENKETEVEKVKDETKQKEYLSNISLKGLERYINERIFGHNEEVKRISTILMMNLTASKEDGTESILLLGPTGVGKTATFEAASDYLNVPFLTINAPNLVPSGIKGESLETNLLSLREIYGDKPEMMERAIIVMDEFDKLEQTDLDIKTALKQILLKFIEGGIFKITENFKEDKSINTKMFSKIFLGSFSDLFQTKRPIGISVGEREQTKEVDAKTLYNSRYFSKELISRIPHIINYLPVDTETQKRIILESKISTFLRKKERFAKEFNITTLGEDEFANGLLERLTAEDKSMRDINNLIDECLIEIQYELLSAPNKYHKLVLRKETATDHNNFDLS